MTNTNMEIFKNEEFGSVRSSRRTASICFAVRMLPEHWDMPDRMRLCLSNARVR